MISNAVTVRIPGSTSNLGSGFDTLGLAVRLYNRVQVTRVEGQGVRVLSALREGPAQNISAALKEGAELFFRRVDKPGFGVEFSLSGDVPFGRGLGASATARLGLIAALNKLSAANLTREELLDIVTALEGHPDNASPALFGGFTVSGKVDGRVRCLHFPVNAKIKLVTLIPNFVIETEDARKLVPAMFSRADTAHSLNRSALISAAFASGNYEQLRGLFDDRLHQPYREKLLPQLSAVIRAGEQAGAIGGWLSGSGSAIICMTLEKAEQVGQAMQRELPECEIKILTADNEGFRTTN